MRCQFLRAYSIVAHAAIPAGNPLTVPRTDAARVRKIQADVDRLAAQVWGMEVGIARHG